MSIAIIALSRQAGKLTELPRNHGWIYGVGSRGGRESLSSSPGTHPIDPGQERRGQRDTRSRKRCYV